jgi:hypothetical protein
MLSGELRCQATDLSLEHVLQIQSENEELAKLIEELQAAMALIMKTHSKQVSVCLVGQ